MGKNLVSYLKGGTQIEDFWEQGGDDNICIHSGEQQEAGYAWMKANFVICKDKTKTIKVNKWRGMRWEGNNNIKINFKETDYEDVAWIHLAQNSVQRCDFVKSVMKIRVQ
jgi:hypothetical protein